MFVELKDLISNNKYILDANDLTGESEDDKKCMKLLQKYDGEAKFISLVDNVIKFQKGEEIFKIYSFEGEHLMYFNKKYQQIIVNDDITFSQVYFTITFAFYK